jgi:hypothetical protein
MGNVNELSECPQALSIQAVASYAQSAGDFRNRMSPIRYLLDCLNPKFLGISLRTHDTPL